MGRSKPPLRPVFYSCRHGNRLWIDELKHAKAAVLAAITRIFHAAKRHLWRGEVEVVHEDHAGIEMLLCELHRAGVVLGEDPTAKAKPAVVGDPHRILIVACANDRGDRTK